MKINCLISFYTLYQNDFLTSPGNHKIRYVFHLDRVFYFICLLILLSIAEATVATTSGQKNQTAMEFTKSAQAQTMILPNDGMFYIELKPVFTFTATLVEKWNWTAQHTNDGTLTIYAPSLPELPSQKKVSTHFMAPKTNHLKPDTIIEQGIDRRQMLALRIPGNQFSPHAGIILKLTYKGTLYARILRQGKPPKSIPSLTDNERRQYLAVSTTMDYDNKDFQQWMKNQNLLRFNEEDIGRFGHRVFKYLIANCKYGGDTSTWDARKPSRVCKTMANDCGGLALLFVAVMRANNIPARTLFGRWAISQTDSYGQYHVIAEFFVDKSGWVPVDIAGTILHKPGDAYAFFGNSDGRHIAFHIDTDLIPEGLWDAWAQNLMKRWTGSDELGTARCFDSQWNVSCQPIKPGRARHR